MAWVKKGLIYSPNKLWKWSQTHAQVPTADLISDNILRIYYSSRDNQNRSRTSFIEVNPQNPFEILYEHSSPILELGAIGTFDESGIMPSTILNSNGFKYLYYTGWSQRKTVPYHNTIGLAISSDGITFRKVGNGPVLSENLLEPFFIGTATVMVDEGLWRCWYASCTGWMVINGSPEPRYHIKYAESENGIDWVRGGEIAIDYKDSSEGGIVRASVIKDELYHMWFSYRAQEDYRLNRKNSYRIGYAQSVDGKRWNRLDDVAGLDISETGWDSEMVAYPNVINIGNQRLMLYNGSALAKTALVMPHGRLIRMIFCEPIEIKKISTIDINQHIKDIILNGYTIIKSYISLQDAVAIRNLLNVIYDENEKRRDFFQDGAPIGFQNLIKHDQMINNLVAYEKVFVDLATKGDYLNIVKHFLNDPYYKLIPEDDPNFILAQLNARAGNVALPFHVDTRMVTEGPSTWSMQGFLAIDDLDMNNGSLRVIPGSHKSGKFPTGETINLLNSIDIESKAGDLILFSSQLHHATRGCERDNSPAWTILLTYRCWWCKQQFNLYEIVNNELFSSLTDNQKLLMGAASVPSSKINTSSSSRVGYEEMWKPNGDNL